MQARFGLRVEIGKLWVQSPYYLAPARVIGEEHGCLGIDKDRFEASREAYKQSLQWLVKPNDLSREEACGSMSVTGDKIVVAVDMPNFAVAMAMSWSVLLVEGSVVKHPTAVSYGV